MNTDTQTKTASDVPETPTLETGSTLDEMIARHKAYGLRVADQAQGKPEAPRIKERNAIAHERDYWKERYNEKLIEAENWLLQRNKALNHAAKLAEALRVARDWLRRSCQIDDQDQADDANTALEAYESSAQ